MGGRQTYRLCTSLAVAKSFSKLTYASKSLADETNNRGCRERGGDRGKWLRTPKPKHQREKDATGLLNVIWLRAEETSRALRRDSYKLQETWNLGITV